MSTYWSLHCKQCDLVSIDDGINHGQHILRSIHALREPIVAIYTQDKSDYLSIEVMGHYNASDIWAFLVEHQGHEMDLKNEYGGIEPIEEEPHASISAQ